MEAFELYLQLTRQGYDLHRTGDSIEWETADNIGGLSISQVESMKKHKKRLLSYIDPRPDMPEDGALWQTVLQEALKESIDFYGFLHSLRCSGCRLIRQDNGRLKLDCSIVEEDMPDVRTRWLLPYKEQISDVFQRVANG